MINLTAKAARPTHAINLEQARIKAGWRSARQAAQAMKIPPSTYACFEAGTRDYTARAKEFAAFFGTKVESLLNSAPEKNSEGRIIPYIEFTAITTLLRAKSTNPRIKSGIEALGGNSDCFITSNPDGAMTDMRQNRPIKAGDFLGFNPATTARAGDLVLAHITGDLEPFFRQFYPQSEGGAIFKALNPNIEPIKLTYSKNWKILARLQFVAFSAETIS